MKFPLLWSDQLVHELNMQLLMLQDNIFPCEFLIQVVPASPVLTIRPCSHPLLSEQVIREVEEVIGLDCSNAVRSRPLFLPHPFRSRTTLPRVPAPASRHSWSAPRRKPCVTPRRTRACGRCCARPRAASASTTSCAWSARSSPLHPTAAWSPYGTLLSLLPCSPLSLIRSRMPRVFVGSLCKVGHGSNLDGGRGRVFVPRAAGCVARRLVIGRWLHLGPVSRVRQPCPRPRTRRTGPAPLLPFSQDASPAPLLSLIRMPVRPPCRHVARALLPCCRTGLRPRQGRHVSYGPGPWAALRLPAQSSYPRDAAQLLPC